MKERKERNLHKTSKDIRHLYVAEGHLENQAFKKGNERERKRTKTPLSDGIVQEIDLMG